MQTIDYSKWSREDLQAATEARSAQAEKAIEADDQQGLAVANASYYAVKFELARRNCRAMAESDAPLTVQDRAEKTMMFFVEQAAYWERLALGVLEGRAA